jgi:hypothetical protein
MSEYLLSHLYSLLVFTYCSLRVFLFKEIFNLIFLAPGFEGYPPMTEIRIKALRIKSRGGDGKGEGSFFEDDIPIIGGGFLTRIIRIGHNGHA